MSFPDPDRVELRTPATSWYPLLEATRAAVVAGDIAGDPEVLAHLLGWAARDRALHHAGRLQLGKPIDDLVEPAPTITGAQ